ncbi:hypothetical protein B0H14DRAFT_279935 [Mycena olivaceomarginata]|nr:hypothetical protein B0H14DRAFT_279935 [Mycena olivaceomarginata]
MRARACADSHVRASCVWTYTASTPALLAPCVVVRFVHCIVQHEQALCLRIAPPRAYTPTLRLALRAPLVAHQTRGASRSRTYVRATATASTLGLAATAAPMSWSNPFRTGKSLFFPPRCTPTLSAPSAVATSPHPRAVSIGGRAPLMPHLCVTIRLQHICVEADTTTASEDAIRQH